MASTSTVLCEEQFLCSICIDVFTNPVTTPCGHNFCMTCIKQYWDCNNLHQCPMCKQKFNRRPELKVNTFISEISAQFKRSVETSITSSLDQLPAKPGEVPCDVCTGEKLQAMKSCLECVVSYCETHLEPHTRVTTLKKHKLINPVENLENKICEKHKRVLKWLCKRDQMYVCEVCVNTDHKAHDTVSIEEESRKRMAQLGKMEAEVKQMIQTRQQKVDEIQQTTKISKKNAEAEIQDSLQVFTALVRSIQRSQAELIEVIEEKQKAAERRAEGLMKELEQEITELKRRSIELEQLSHTEDHLHLLQSFPSLSTPPPGKDWSETSVQSVTYVGSVRRAVRRVGSELEETLKTEVKRLCETEMKMVQQYAVDVTLDPDTAHPNLMLSEDVQQIKHGGRRQNLPDNPERFYYIGSVLGREGFSSGRFYYEVQVKGNTDWTVGVAKESIDRKLYTVNPESGLWTVQLLKGKVFKACASEPVTLSLSEKAQKVGVYVDYEEGVVSLYDAHASSHIYSFIGCTFTEKLHPYFSLGVYGIGQMSAPLIISPVSQSN